MKMKMKTDLDFRFVCIYDKKLVSLCPLLMGIQLDLHKKKVVNKFGHCTALKHQTGAIAQYFMGSHNGG